MGGDPILRYSGGELLYIYHRRNDDSNLVYQVETSTNLVSNVWTSTGYTVQGIHEFGGGMYYDAVTNLLSREWRKQFIRLIIADEPEIL